MDADSQEFMRALRQLTAEIKADHAELRAELRAQRQALFRMLDRFDDGGSTAGA